MSSTMWHVSSVLNRASIQEHGLDWTRMGAARGIAGSSHPEADGIFLGHDLFDAHYFARMNNTGGPVDVWAVDGVDVEDLRDNGSGYQFLPRQVVRTDIYLRYGDVTMRERRSGSFTEIDLRAALEPFRHHADGRKRSRPLRRSGPG